LFVKRNALHRGQDLLNDTSTRDYLSKDQNDDTRLQNRRSALLRKLEEIEKIQRREDHKRIMERHNESYNKSALTHNVNTSIYKNNTLTAQNKEQDRVNSERNDFIRGIASVNEIKLDVGTANRFTLDSPLMEFVYISNQTSGAFNEKTERRDGIADSKAQANIDSYCSPASLHHQSFFMKQRVKIPTFSGRYDKLSPFQLITEFKRYALAQGMQPYEIIHKDMPCALLADA
jgi:hypothetical protein